MNESYKKGDLLLVKYPYSDFSDIKVRPALVLATIDGDNVIVAQITTKKRNNLKYSIKIENDLLKFTSFVRLDFIMTLDKSYILKLIGNFDKKNLKELNEKLIEIFNVI